MAGQGSNDGPSASYVSAELSDSTVQLNVKTLDSRIYSFQADKNMLVSLLKEKIANETGVPVGQQRLIFRGKVLKDNHVLSEYHIENGDTLHLVQRQLNQSQAPITSSGETTGTSGDRGNDGSSGAHHNRVGQISHSVVLGTFNMGDQGEGIVPDLNRVIGAVLNSIGIGGQSTVGVTNGTQSSSGPSGNEAVGMHVENQNQPGNQAQTGQIFPNQPFQSLPQVVQIPLAAGSITVPSLSAPIPHSLDTLSEFINRMEQTLSQNGYQTNPSSVIGGEQAHVELPSSPQGLPTVEALSVVLHRAERLLSGHAIAALSYIAGRLEREGTTSDPNIRGQIQSESMQIGLAMQHLGAFLLELGRTTLTLRMGQSSAESAVNAGPAVYISPSGPNPIMVQPFPLQAGSLSGGSVPPTPATFGTVGAGNAPRNVNIHIHAGTSLAPIVSSIGSRPNNGEGAPNERRNAPGSGDLGSVRALPLRNIIAAAVPAYPSGTGTSSGIPSSGVPTSQLPYDSVALSSVIADINSRTRNILGNIRGDNTVLSGQAESTNRELPVGRESRPSTGNEQLDTMEANAVEASSVSSVACTSESGVREPQPETAQTSNNEGRDVLSSTFGSSSSNQDSVSWSRGEKSENAQENSQSAGENHATESAKAVPLGLGASGLERKRRTRSQHPVSRGADDGLGSSSGNQNQQARTSGHNNVLQDPASHGTSMNQGNANGPSQVPNSPGDSQIDVASVMSQVLHSPALNGLLTGVSQQTGIGSPDVLRNMLQQFTQSPQMRNTVNQIAQQVDSQDMGNMFSGMERGQGSGFDFSRMLQQMMPIVSQALGGGTPSQSFSAERRDPQALYGDGTRSRDDNVDDQSLQINLQSVVERMEHLSTQSDVFRAVVENAIQLSRGGSSYDGLLDELCSDECLAGDYVEILRHDASQRMDGDSGRG